MGNATNKKLTKKLVDSLTAPSSGETIIWDTEIAGFFIRVLSSGTKTYNLKYRMPGGRGAKQGQVKIGRSNEMTVEQARQDALDHKEKIRKNIDPKDKRKKSEIVSVADLINGYLDKVEKSGVAGTFRQYKSIADNHVFPRFKSRDVASIKYQDIFDLHKKMATTPYQANRALALISAAFSWGKKTKMIDIENPCIGVEKYEEKHKTNFLDAEKLARLEKVLQEAEKKGLKFFDKRKKTASIYTFSPYVIAAIRTLIHTGARLNEVLSLEWNQIDWAQQLLRLPDTKTGQRDIRISITALNILKKIERVKDNPYVFVGHVSKTHLVNVQKSWGVIRKRAGLDGIRIHDLRHTFASTAINAGVPLQVVGGMLGHKNVATTARYAHLADDALKAGIAKTELAVNEAMKSKK